MRQAREFHLRAAVAALAVVVGSSVAGGVGPLAPAAPAVAAEVLSHIARGGRLYDDWHTELGVRERSLSHLPDPEVSGAAAEGRGRCVSCHGWDYRGVPGVEGGTLTGVIGADPAAVAAVLTDATHGYGTYMDEADLQDLALFVTRGQVAMDRWVNRASGRATGSPARGADVVQSICAGCHGVDGMAVSDMPPLGTFSRTEPWHAMHVMLNGHPNGSMPPLRALGPGALSDALATLQTLPDRPAIAAIVRGGRLYNAWFTELGHVVPDGWHPAWPAERRASDAAASEGDVGLRAAQSRSWRCSACHGWDYRGRDGLALGSPPAPFSSLKRMAGADPDVIAAAITDETHGYGRYLSPRDISDLALFVSQGQIDMAPRIHPDTGHFLADAAAYEGHYHTICATCHGADGRAVRTMPPLGRAVTEQPQRALHSVFNGHPGEAMPPLRALGLDITTGILAFAETLPIHKRD